MKILYCKNCNSIFNIDLEAYECKCGKTKGKYIDNLNAIYCGRYAKPMGLDNRDLALRLAKRIDLNALDIIIGLSIGKYIRLWFIEKDDCCSTFIKVSNKDYKLKTL